MILSKTPFRISFFGGGTDMRDFYSQDYGAVLGMTIDKRMYIMMNKKFDDKVRVSYSQTENVSAVDELKHSLVREVLAFYGIKNGIEIITMADIPDKGTGLGSSSSTAVGLVKTISSYLGFSLSSSETATIACEIEIGKLGAPIGKQDQYFAAYGGFNYIKFNSDESVSVVPLDLKRETEQELEENLLCFYTGITRSSSTILTEQKANMSRFRDLMTRMRDQAEEGMTVLRSGDLTKFGVMLNDAWQMKRQLANSISNDLIDKYYAKALANGALGGKITGAGGGGFLVLYCEKRKQEQLLETLKDLARINIRLEKEGSKILVCD